MRSLKKLLESFVKRHYMFKGMIFCTEYQRGWFLTGTTRTAAYRRTYSCVQRCLSVYTAWITLFIAQNGFVKPNESMK